MNDTKIIDMIGVKRSSVKNKKFDNIVEIISNYATNALQETLTQYGEKGYQLVSTIMAKNRYNIDVMYCFFTKEIT